jgi:hypothetical protein
MKYHQPNSTTEVGQTSKGSTLLHPGQSKNYKTKEKGRKNEYHTI